MIILASDHAGFLLKEDIKKFFKKENITTIDVGCYSMEPVDYPDFAKSANQKVLENDNNIGIYICGTGIGMDICANRNPKIRAALCPNPTYARLARSHNNANVLCLGERVIGEHLALDIVDIWLKTGFEGGRHKRRVDMLE